MTLILCAPTAGGVLIAADDRGTYDNRELGYRDDMNKIGIAKTTPLTLYAVGSDVWLWKHDPKAPPTTTEWYEQNQPVWSAHAELGKILEANPYFLSKREDREKLGKRLAAVYYRTLKGHVTPENIEARKFTAVLGQHYGGLGYTIQYEVKWISEKKTDFKIEHFYGRGDSQPVVCLAPGGGDAFKQVYDAGTGGVKLKAVIDQHTQIANFDVPAAMAAFKEAIQDTSKACEEGLQTECVGMKAFFALVRNGELIPHPASQPGT